MLSLITDMIMKLKEVYGKYILILVLMRNAVIDEDTVKKKAWDELNVAVDLSNSFRKWARNKTEESYVFQDWIQSDKKYDENDLHKTQREILQAVERRKTKFVLVFPFKVWTENKILNEMESWNLCRKTTIHPSAT